MSGCRERASNAGWSNAVRRSSSPLAGHYTLSVPKDVPSCSVLSHGCTATQLMHRDTPASRQQVQSSDHAWLNRQVLGRCQHPHSVSLDLGYFLQLLS